MARSNVPGLCDFWRLINRLRGQARSHKDRANPVGAGLPAKASSATQQFYRSASKPGFTAAGFNTNHNATAINTPP